MFSAAALAPPLGPRLMHATAVRFRNPPAAACDLDQLPILLGGTTGLTPLFVSASFVLARLIDVAALFIFVEENMR